MTVAQRKRRAKAIVAAAARAMRDERGRPRPLPYALIGRAVELSGQRVKELVAELEAEAASNSAGAKFSTSTYRESFAASSATHRKLRPVRSR